MKIINKVKVKMFKVLALATVLNSVSQALSSDASNEIEVSGGPGDARCPFRGYKKQR